MAGDPSPHVRTYVADTILDNEEAWAKKLCAQLRYDKNPLVREVFERRQDNRETAYNPMPRTWQEEAGIIAGGQCCKKTGRSLQ